jgi:cellulose synthase/poly-beta-1,6-N-acetylglucosamine synthase-like glycosyltransferase
MNRRTGARWVFWGSLGVIAYAYVGFPLIVAMRGAFRRRPFKSGTDTPTVSLIIAAHNEAAVIMQKLDNSLSLEYPREKFEVIVASDGSDDATNEIVAAYEAPEVRLLTLPRQGKNVTLNQAAAAARGDILVFSDADTMLTSDAVRHLVTAFADPEVGGVAGERRHAKQVGKATIHRAVWRLKRGLRELLSRAGSVTAAEGQVHAVRRELFEPIPLNVLDDAWISMQVVAAHRRLAYEPLAASYPFVGATALRTPFERRRRVTRYWLRGVWSLRRLFNPLEYGFYAVQLFSHKFLRRLLFVPLLGLAGSAPALWSRGRFYKLVTLAEASLHGAAVVGFLFREHRIGHLKPMRAAFAFDMLNAANLAALVDLLRHRRERDDIWVPQRAVAQEPGSDADPGGAAEAQSTAASEKRRRSPGDSRRSIDSRRRLT